MHTCLKAIVPAETTLVRNMKLDLKKELQHGDFSNGLPWQGSWSQPLNKGLNAGFGMGDRIRIYNGGAGCKYPGATTLAHGINSEPI